MKTTFRNAAIVCGFLLAIILVRAAVPTGQSGTWQVGGSMASHDLGALAPMPDGSLLVVGGGSANVDLFTANGGIIGKAPMSVARTGHTATVLFDGRVLVAGG